MSKEAWAHGKPYRPVVTRRRRLWSAFVVLTAFFTVGAAAGAFASSVDIAVVDVTAPVGSISLQAGDSGPITINSTVTGPNAGTATFQVYRDWTLSGGVFTGSNPQTFTVPVRSTGAAAATFSTTGTVSVASGQATGTFTLAVSAFSITNSNQTGAKLSDGSDSNYQITVIPPANTPPSFGALSNLSAEATSGSGAVVTFTANASDSEDGSIAGTCTPASGSTFPLGTTTVNCSATDSGGLTTTASFLVTITDTTAPVLVVPADITVEATGASGAVVTYAASATDIVDGPVSVSCSPASGSTFALGTTQVTCSATDAHSNGASASFNVTVQDTTPPTLNLPTSFTIEATGANGAVANFQASATDLVDGPVTVVCSPAVGSTLPLGTTTVDCSATDAHTNTASGSFDVTVEDTTPPSLSLPADITAEATGPSGAAVTYSASANDLVDGSVAVTCSPASGSTFGLGNTQVKCSATDSHNNTANGSFDVTVQDTTPPSLNLPSNITVNASGNSQAVVTYSASASDLVDGSVPVTCSPASGSSFPVGTTTVNCSATDSHSNTANGSFTVTVSYNWTGFFQPVDNVGWNVAKAGQSIPVKFSLGGDQGLSVLKSGYPKITSTLCPSPGATLDQIEEYVTGTANTGLVYDATTAQYNYIWKTDKSWANKCFQFDLGLKDGSTHTFKVQFTR